MTKCDYCGEKIGFFSVMYTWLDKNKDLAVHDKCSKEWWEKLPDKQEGWEKIFQEDYFKGLSQNERQETFDYYLKTLDKDLLYLCHTKPKLKKHTDEERINDLEKIIEYIKKDENFPDKEKTLKTLNDMLKFLKKRGIIFP